VDPAKADVESLFCDALDIASAEERAAYLDRACRQDGDLRQRVERLLAAHGAAPSFLAARPPLAAAPCDSLAESVGTLIGPYKLLEQIGEGGFGVVFMAEQTRPLCRKVALKVLKPGMDTRQVIARFEAERQALALMDHPSIAHVHDGGETASGRPYFVMELVKGIPITEFCDQNQLSVGQRLELFLNVCQAVQHAHQKGIIHRDIKPSNILVTLHDGTPVVKVIDFGIAKATGQRLTDKTLFTNFAQMIGTPLYMSPEQAALSGLDVDTRSDIYSLGVLLYELLTGTPPFDKERLKTVGYDEMCRIIREEDPPRPSTRISTLGLAATTAATQRKSDPKQLSRLFRGELDWIVMKAMEKDRNRRYETANGLARDIERYLRDEAVLACPPSTAYRLRKLLRRNRAAVLVGAVVVLALVLLVLGLVVSNVLIMREKDQKVDALKDKEVALITARQAELTARRRFYAAQMNLAQQAWEAGNPARVLDLLEGQRPGPEEEDLRSFEWYYLWHLCHQGDRLRLKTPNTRASFLAFSTDGKTLAAGYRDATARLWDIATGRQEAIAKSDGGEFTSLAFTPDSRSLLIVNVRGSMNLKRWDLATDRDTVLLDGRQGGVWCAAFSPDGKTLATGAEDGTVLLRDPVTLKGQATLCKHNNPVYCLAFSPDGKRLATSSAWGEDNGRVIICDLPSRSARRLPAAGAYSLAFSPDSQRLALSGSESAPARLFEVATGRQCLSFERHPGVVYAVAFSPDGQMLAAGGNDRTVRLYDVRTGEQRLSYADAGPIFAVDFSPDGKTLASAGYDGTITLRDVTPVGDELTLPGAGTTVAFAPDGKTLATSGAAALRLWDVASWKETAAFAFTGPSEPEEALAFAHDGKSLAVAHYHTLRLFDVAPLRERVSLNEAQTFWSVAFSPDDQKLASASKWQPYVSLRHSRTLAERGTLAPDAEAWARICAFSPDGALVATGSQFGVLKLFDVATGQVRATLQPGEKGPDWVGYLAFSPDGKLLASSDRQGTVKLWDIATGELRTVLKGHTDAVDVLGFSADSGTLATGGQDRTVKLWDVATGQERITLKGFAAPVRSLAFGPDDRLLVAGSEDGTVRVWRAATDAEALARRAGAPAN
jgi:WD40 repeat protein/serine/threonine protein kinase